MSNGEEPIPNHVSEWIEDSISYFPMFFDDPYETGDFIGDSWWVQGQNLEQDIIDDSFITNSSMTSAALPLPPTPTDSIILLDSTKKRKLPDDHNSKKPRKTTIKRADERDLGPVSTEPGVVVPRKQTFTFDFQTP